MIHIIKLWLAVNLKWLRKYLLSEREKEQLMMVQFRSIAARFGCDLSSMSDEDLKKGIIYAGKEISKTGMSVSEIGKAVASFKKSQKVVNTNLLDSEDIRCDVCGAIPLAIIKTNHGTFCASHAKF